MKFTAQQKQLLLPIVYLALFFGIYTAFTKDSVYHATLGHVIKPYKGMDKYLAGGKRVDEPYVPIEKERLQNWDARTYYQIGEHGYYKYYTTAFFPLFPLVFKLTGFSWLIIIVNFLLFALSLYYLFRHLCLPLLKDNPQVFLLLISIPSVFVFFIPYSEALFFFCFTLFIAGFLKGNKYLLFTGLLLAATTRPIVTIVLLSVLSVEFIRLLYTRSTKATVNSLLLFLTPMLAGTFIAAFVQYLYTGSFFNFITVQEKEWQHYFRLPTKISDWSEEGHTLNVFTFLFVVLPVIRYCITTFISACKKQGQLFSGKQILSATVAEKTTYLSILSAAYIVGSFLFILFFQGGSLNGLFRYILCTPFFYILVIALLNGLQTITPDQRKTMLKTIGVLTALFLIWIGAFNLRLINMVEFSFLYMLAVLLLMVYYNSLPPKAAFAITCILAFLGLVYQTYLFNSFLANSWILT